MLAFLSTRTHLSTREFGGIVINELYSTQPKTSRDWIELLNTGTDTIDLSGWELYVDGILVYTFSEVVGPWEFVVVTDLDFAKGELYELLDASGTVIDSVLLELWQVKSYGRVGNVSDEYDNWVWMNPTPGDWNEGQVPIPEFESVVMPVAIVTIMFFAIRRRRRERTTEENREGESDDGHE